MLMQDIEVKVYRSHVKIPVIFFVPAAFLVTVYALLYMYLNSNLFVDTLERNLNERLPGDVAVSELAFDPTLTRLHVFDARLNGGDGREIIVARKVDASLNPLSLLIRRIELYDIDVQSGGVNMTIPEAADSEIDLMVALGLTGPDEPEDDEPALIEGVLLRGIQCTGCFYTLDLGFMKLDVPEINLEDGTIDTTHVLSMSVPQLHVNDLFIRFEPRLFGYEPDRGVWELHVEDVDIENWQWANEGFGVEQIDLLVDGIQVSATGDMRFPDAENPEDEDPGGGMLYWGQGTVHIPYWSRIGHYFIDDHVHAQLTANIAVEGSLDEIVGGFEFEAPVVEASGLRMTGVSGKGSLVDDMVFVDEGSGSAHGGTFELKNVFYSMFEGIYGGRAILRGVDPYGVLGDFGFDYPYLGGSASAAVSVLGWVPYDPEFSPGDDPIKERVAEATEPVVWLTLENDLVLSRSSREVLPGSTVRIRSGAEAWADLDSVGLPSAEVGFDSARLRVDDFTLNYLDNRLTEEARLRLSSEELGRLMQDYGAPKIDGRLTAEMTAEGLLNYPDVGYEIRVSQGSFANEDIEATGIAAKFGGRLADGRLAIETGNLESSRGRVQIDGWMDVLRNPRGVLDAETGAQTTDYLSVRRHNADLGIEVDQVDVALFKPYLPGFLGARGRAFASANLRRSLENPVLDVEGRIEQGELLGQPLRALEVRGGLTGTEANLERFFIDAGVAGNVGGSGLYSFSDRAFAVSIEGNELDLEKVVYLRERLPFIVEGKGSFALNGTGTPASPDLAGHLVFRDLKAANRDIGDLSVVANTLGDTVYFEGALLPWIALHFEAPLDDSSPFYAKLGLDHLDLASAVDELRESPFVKEAEATGTVELFLERDFSRYQVLANFDEVKVASLDRVFVNDGPVIVGYNNEELLQIQQARIGSGDRFVSVQGGMFLDESLIDLQVRGDLDLALLNSFRATIPEYFPDSVIEATGVLALDANLKGTPGNLLTSGYVRFQPTEILLRDVSDPLYITAGTVEFDRDSIRIDPSDPVRGRALQGRFEMNGTMGFEQLQPQDLRLRIQSANMSYRLPQVANLTFGTDIELIAPDLDRYDTWQVTGAVDVVDGLYYENISIFQEQLTNRILGAFNRTTETYEASVLERFPMLEEVEFDVALRARDGFRVESEIDRLELDLELRVDVRLQKTLLAPQLDGEVDVLDGRVTFQGERFDVRNGTVRFTGSPNNPVVDIVADSDVNNRCREPDIGDETRRSLSLKGDFADEEERIFHVILTVQGRLDNMAVQFESNPYADQRDILSLILTGCTVDQLTASSASSPTLEVALAPVLGWIEGTVQDVVEVEEFTITPSVDRLRTSIGDRLSRRLRWRLQVDTGLTEPTGGQLAQLEYKISDAWAAELSESSRSEDDSFVIDFKLKYRIFLD